MRSDPSQRKVNPTGGDDVAGLQQHLAIGLQLSGKRGRLGRTVPSPNRRTFVIDDDEFVGRKFEQQVDRPVPVAPFAPWNTDRYFRMTQGARELGLNPGLGSEARTARSTGCVACRDLRRRPVLPGTAAET